MSSREAILKSIRQHLPESSPLPELDGPWLTFDDPVAQFASVLEMIGGRCVRVPDRSAIVAALQDVPAWVAARTRFVSVPGLENEGAREAAVDDPHELNNVDFAVLPGEFGVAENAAVWVRGDRVQHRVIYFLCQHLALVISSADIVNHMFEAYQRIEISQPLFGAFIAGPSKTADIEQSLVIGAHGPRSMTVIIVES